MFLVLDPTEVNSMIFMCTRSNLEDADKDQGEGDNYALFLLHTFILKAPFC